MNVSRALCTALLVLSPVRLYAQFDPIGTITAVVDGRFEVDQAIYFELESGAE